MSTIPTGLSECLCPNLSRGSEHGQVIREAYETAVVQIIKNFTVSRDSLISGECNVAIIGSGGLYQDYRWLKRLFDEGGAPPINLHLVDITYEYDDSSVRALESLFARQIGSKTLSIQEWVSCEALAAEYKKQDLIIGMDTEHATDDAVGYQCEALLRGDLQRTLIVRWNKDDLSGRSSYNVFSRKGSELDTCLPYYYDPSDLRSMARVAHEVARRILQVSWT